MNCNRLGFYVFTRTQSLFRLMSIELVMSSNLLIFSCPLLLLPSLFPSVRVFSSELALHIRWPKLKLQLEDQSFQWVFRTDFLRIHWIDLLAIKGILKSLLQYHSWKESILQCSDFFMVQLSRMYMTTGKTIPLNIWAFVGKMMSLLFNMLFRFVLVEWLPVSLAD